MSVYPDTEALNSAKIIREQRRYEIAKAVLAGFAADFDGDSTPHGSNAAEQAVRWADALLAELER